MPKEKTTFALIDPEVHLTDACWKSFRKWVLGHTGWSAARVACTDAERLTRQETRRGKTFWVRAVYDPRRASRTLPAAGQGGTQPAVASGMTAWSKAKRKEEKEISKQAKADEKAWDMEAEALAKCKRRKRAPAPEPAVQMLPAKCSSSKAAKKAKAGR